MNVKIYVVSHKPYHMPEDPVYEQICVGPAVTQPFCALTDATGDNIAQKNPNYCELTALYWIWKNTQEDYTGLVHYRRYFSSCTVLLDKWNRVMTKKDLEKILQTCDVIVPVPRHYIIETGWSQYAHAHHEDDLVKTRQCIQELCPEYLPAFDAAFKRTWGHRFNMFVMKRKLLDAYCSWLFPILFLLEKRLDVSSYNAYNARVFGFIGERLLDVWLMHHKIHYREVRVIHMESQKWLSKGIRFVKRKLAATKFS